MVLGGYPTCGMYYLKLAGVENMSELMRKSIVISYCGFNENNYS
jgi:hypothetical protein